MAGLPIKTAKVEPPPTPPRSPTPSSSDEDGDGSSSDSGEEAPREAALAPPPPAPAPPNPPVADVAPPVRPAAKAAARRGRQAARAEEVLDPRGYPAGFNADGTAAPECERGRKIRTGLILKGSSHCRTCPDGRFWKWELLGARQAEARATVDASRAAGGV